MGRGKAVKIVAAPSCVHVLYMSARRQAGPALEEVEEEKKIHPPLPRLTLSFKLIFKGQGFGVDVFGLYIVFSFRLSRKDLESFPVQISWATKCCN